MAPGTKGSSKTAAGSGAPHAPSRRNFLRLLGGAAGVALVAPRKEAFAAEQEHSGRGNHPRPGPGETEESTNRLRRWAMVVDLRRCDGCTGLGLPPQCTQYCIWGRLVPEGQEWVEVYTVRTSEHLSPSEDGSPMCLPAFCMQCQNAPCANVCPVGATFHAPDGVVLIDQMRCIGCRLCMAACPYDRRFFNWSEPVQPDWVKKVPYEVRTQVPAIRGTVMKCDFCTERAAAGGLPFCVDGCPNGAIYFGDLEQDVATNGREIVKLSRFLEENHAFRYKEELGTEPRVWYIPGHGQLVREGQGSANPGAHRPLRERLEWPWRTLAAAARQGPREGATGQRSRG